MLNTIKQQNDILSPILHVIRDEIDTPYTVYPHASDPPLNDFSKTTSPKQTDRPPDTLDILSQYTDYHMSHDSSGVIRSVKQCSVEYLIHHDSGANRSVTNKRELLHSIEPIPKVCIQGANKGTGFLNCTEKGIFNLTCTDGSIIPVTVYITDDVEGTILSPTDICISHYNKFSTWEQRSEINSNKGYL